MKFVALVSGGKDSLYSIQESIRNGHELICCVHLGAPASVEEESFMYQTAGSSVLPILVEECLGVPLVLHPRTGKSLNTSLVYDGEAQQDEVEDLFVALKKAMDQFPDIAALSSGAILSTYQRVRIEHVCSRLGLASLSYLWRLAPQKELLKKMIDDGIEAVLVKTACPPGLIPSKHLNKTLGDLYYSGLMDRLYERYRFHYCGEGGEYESLVIDCPLYKKRLVIDEVEIDETDDGVGELRITKCHAEDKIDNAPAPALQKAKEEIIPHSPANNEGQHLNLSIEPIRCLPRVRRLPGGLLHVSEIMSPIPAQGKSEAELAVDEALSIFAQLNSVLATLGGSCLDVMMVHVYLAEIAHFANINTHYRAVFGTLLPPSRSCVSVGQHVLPGGRRIMLDCMIQLGSGAYMREQQDGGYATGALQTKTSNLRHVLHVQSISHWAPVCVGPYSQVNTLRSGLHFVAGQIGLDPPTMKLKGGWENQLKQTWTNLANILDCLEGGSLSNLLSCLIYVSSHVTDWALVEQISRDMIASNGNVVPGAVDSTAALSELYGGYEDEETWREMTRSDAKVGHHVPLLIIEIPEMPVGAQIEVETISVTAKAAKYLDLKLSSSVTTVNVAMNVPSETWDTGANDTKKPVNTSDGHHQLETSDQSFQKAKVNLQHQASDLSIPFDQESDAENEAAQKRTISHRESNMFLPFDQRVDTAIHSTLDENCSLSGSLVSKQIAEEEHKVGEEVDASYTVQSAYMTSLAWSTGHDFDIQRREETASAVQIHVSTLALGEGCAAMSTVVASIIASTRASFLEPEAVLSEMIDAAISSLEARALGDEHVFQVRLYHVATDSAGTPKDDGIQWRLALSMTLALRAGRKTLGRFDVAAASVVPVRGMKFVPNVNQTHAPFVAIQMLAIDPVHMETELWIHDGRGD